MGSPKAQSGQVGFVTGLSRILPRCAPLIALALLAALLVTGTARDAWADFYRCRIDGREWLTNHIPKGQRRHCRLAMKTGSRPEEQPDASSTAGSVRTRGAAARSRLKPRVSPHTPSPRSAAELPNARIWRIVLEAAGRYHLPPAFLLGVIKVESDFHPHAVSRVGAMGLMQLMPKTADGLGVTDAFDPRQNIMAGSRYLRMLANRFDGDMVRTIAGYHAGGSAVEKKEGVPYAATEQYVRWVLDRYYQYKVILLDEGL